MAEINWTDLATQKNLHNFIRGNDSVPGAWTTINGRKIALFGSSLWKRFEVPGNAHAVPADGIPGGIVFVHEKGMLIPTPNDKKFVKNLNKFKLNYR